MGLKPKTARSVGQCSKPTELLGLLLKSDEVMRKSPLPHSNLFPSLFTIFTKENDFCDFLFASLGNKGLPKWSLLLQERICSLFLGIYSAVKEKNLLPTHKGILLCLKEGIMFKGKNLLKRSLRSKFFPLRARGESFFRANAFFK